MKILRNRILFLLLIFLINGSVVYAQLGFCSGNSGNAIFTETFGTGTDFGPQLPAGTTTYNFIGNSGPQDGQYTIGSGTSSNGWNLPSDHTPNDTNGKCFIVNADFTSGEFYKTEINGLCGETTYEFSAWLINILPVGGCDGAGIPVNVKFEIWDITDTNRLASGDTGNIFGISTPTWQSYGLVFQTLIGQSSVLLKMINNGIGGCGNDLAVDDIVFKTCGDRVVLDDNVGDTNFKACEDELITNVTLTATPDFSVFSTHVYQWQVSTNNVNWNDIVGATTNVLNAPAPIPSGILYYRVKFAESALNLQNSSCNSISEIFQIKINPFITPTFSQIGPICNGTSFTLPTTSTNAISGTWSPSINTTMTTTYTFTPNIDECATTQTLTVQVKQAITPVFDSVPATCSGDSLNPLPTTSNNGISGTWFPELDNTITTTYTFTPNEGECSILTTLTIVVNYGPQLNLDSTYIICTETNGTQVVQSPNIDTNLSDADYSFVWMNGLGEVVSIASSFTPSVIGTYSVTVTNNLTGCQSEATTEVIESSPLSLEISMISDAFSDNGIIEVSTVGNGNYEYSLDNGSWQQNPIFSNVSAGIHTVSARDKNGCGFTTIDTCLIGAPNFFTPNGDGINETWTIKGASCLACATIFIFDRYGKLLKEFDLNSPGWNGTFNNEKLPTSDYWFVIKYRETTSDTEKEYKGHFTLKR